MKTQKLSFDNFEAVGIEDLLQIKGGDRPSVNHSRTAILEEGGGGGGCGGYYVPINGDGIAQSMEYSIHNFMSSPIMKSLSDGVYAVGNSIVKQAELTWIVVKAGVGRLLPVNTGPINPNLMNPPGGAYPPENITASNNGCN